MAELVAAIVVVCLPALRTLVHRIETSSSKRGATSTLFGTGYNSYTKPTSHVKLSSGRDAYSTTTRVAAAAGEDSGSEVELNTIQRQDRIYKSDRVSVTYQRREDAD